jgi:SAM-dependent methyltransferase
VLRPTERFSDRVRDYVRYRPGYPAAVLEVLEREVGLSRDWVVADLGSGTGLSAELFLGHGNPVVAVEPNRAMREAADSLLGGRAGFRSVAGTAEATGLPAASVDLVVAAQAFHWFDPDGAREEVARILRPEGWVALLWNTRRTGASAFLLEYEDLLVRHGTDYARVRHDRQDPGVLDRFFRGGFSRRVVPTEQKLELQGFLGRLSSASYTPAEGDPARARMLREAAALFRRHAVEGWVRMEYDTEILVGRVGRVGSGGPNGAP